LIFSTCKDLDLDEKTKQTLLLLEKVNPCGQQYLTDGKSLAILYRQKIDLLNFVKGLSLKITLPIVGLPYSVATKGYSGNPSDVVRLLDQVKGLKIILNGDDDLNLAKAPMLPTYVLDLEWSSFDDYLSSMRSHYRYRLRKALKKGKTISINQIPNEQFDDALYKLYLNVYSRASDQLECLSASFFREHDAKIHTFHIPGKQSPVAFIQTKITDNRLKFLFCGLEQEHVRTHDLYINMLLFIIRMGIDNRVETIEFGQTTADSKMKVGCKEVKKYLYIHHHWSWVVKLASWIVPFFGYKESGETLNVFKPNESSNVETDDEYESAA
jgi:hypothetical protein